MKRKPRKIWLPILTTDGRDAYFARELVFLIKFRRTWYAKSGVLRATGKTYDGCLQALGQLLRGKYPSPQTASEYGVFSLMRFNPEIWSS